MKKEMNEIYKEQTKRKKDLIDMIRENHWEEFCKEVERDETVSLFGEYGFDDVDVYLKNYDLTEEEYDKVWFMAESQYMNDRNLIEMYDGESQWIIKVVADFSGYKIINKEYHWELFEDVMKYLKIDFNNR